MFNIALRKLFKHQYGYEMNVIEYGKPNDATYQFVEGIVKNKKCYMIGDNLMTDIKGANDRNKKIIKKSEKVEWVSIAVKSGVFKGT